LGCSGVEQLEREEEEWGEAQSGTILVAEESTPTRGPLLELDYSIDICAEVRGVLDPAGNKEHPPENESWQQEDKNTTKQCRPMVCQQAHRAAC
jgi:hypothetical protein